MPRIKLGRKPIAVSDVDVISVDCTDWLDSGELLTGTPTITERTSFGDIAFANNVVNGSAITMFGRTIAASSAVQWKVSGQSRKANGDPQIYEVEFSVTTDATPARTLVRSVELEVI
jgi:hypothetical protein